MTPRLLQLYAVRAQIDALVAAEEAEIGIQARVEPGSCPHCGAGHEQQGDKSTLDGTKRKLCKACGQEWIG